MNKHSVPRCDDLPDRTPTGALVENVDLVIVRFGDAVSAFYGRCLHRGVMLSDGLNGHNLICGVHNWGYRVDTGISAYVNDEKLPKFNAWIEGGDVLVDTDEIKQWKQENPQPYDRKGYLGQYADLMVPTKNPARLHHHALGRVIIRLLGPSEKLTNRQLN